MNIFFDKFLINRYDIFIKNTNQINRLLTIILFIIIVVIYIMVYTNHKEELK